MKTKLMKITNNSSKSDNSSNNDNFNNLYKLNKLANASVIHPEEPGANLDRTFSYSVCHGVEFKFAGC
jgi:hypothetical protein